MMQAALQWPQWLQTTVTPGQLSVAFVGFVKQKLTCVLFQNVECARSVIAVYNAQRNQRKVAHNILYA